jgi:hypothetical protein
VPERPDTLDDRLKEARSDLLREIRLPELAHVRARAGRIRRRRNRLTAAASALALLLVVGLGTALINGRATAPDPAASQDPTGTVWRGGGLTLLGLNGPVLDQPGDLIDVEFADADHGYALSADCGGGSSICRFALATSADGGRTWTPWPLPFEQASSSRPPPSLFAVGDGLVLRTDIESWFASRDDPRWWSVRLDEPAVDTIPPGARLSEPADCGGPLTVWRANLTEAPLATSPDMIVCSVTRSGGSWWVAGRTADATAPAVGVSDDAGATWTVTALPAGDGVAQVSVRGNQVYASVVLPRGGNPYPETQTVTAVYLSVDNGPFTARMTDAGTVVGDVVPLSDGRLVAAGPDWQISTGDRGSWQRAGGSLPWVHRIALTPGGWVAYDLFHQGWAAVSYDGETWQKINVR